MGLCKVNISNRFRQRFCRYVDKIPRPMHDDPRRDQARRAYSIQTSTNARTFSQLLYRSLKHQVLLHAVDVHYPVATGSRMQRPAVDIPFPPRHNYERPQSRLQTWVP